MPVIYDVANAVAIDEDRGPKVRVAACAAAGAELQTSSTDLNKA